MFYLDIIYVDIMGINLLVNCVISFSLSKHQKNLSEKILTDFSNIFSSEGILWSRVHNIRPHTAFSFNKAVVSGALLEQERVVKSAPPAVSGAAPAKRCLCSETARGSAARLRREHGAGKGQSKNSGEKK